MRSRWEPTISRRRLSPQSDSRTLSARSEENTSLNLATMAAVEGAPRLVISKMVMENFKSYAGEQMVGPFHQCFSSVVGPNGSGKSNVIDALLFVFGRKASKIRQKSVVELIHNSESHKDLQYCKVSVYFQDIVDKVCWFLATLHGEGVGSV